MARGAKEGAFYIAPTLAKVLGSSAKSDNHGTYVLSHFTWDRHVFVRKKLPKSASELRDVCRVYKPSPDAIGFTSNLIQSNAVDLPEDHIGCDTGHCGACTVILDGASVKSCMLFAVQADGSSVLTIEGVAQDPNLRAIQDAFSENHALQCGYCMPGMILSGLFLLQRNPQPSDDEIKAGIEGNLCRCTGYLAIVNAVKAAAAKIRKSKLTQ